MKLFLRALAILALTTAAHAADRQAASCSFSDVQSAYNAAVDGDRVLIPAGACTWNQTLTVAKGVQIIGAGNGSTAADTQITGARFSITTPSGKAVRVSSFRTSGTAGFNISGATKAFRIDNVYFQGVAGFSNDRVIWIQCASNDYCAGLIDHNTFDTINGSINIHVREDAGNGNNSWNRPLGLGGPDAIYIEDNLFTRPANTYEIEGAASTDCDGGGRLVFRYNTLRNAWFMMHDAIVVGLMGCRKWEVYENHWVSTAQEIAQSGQFAQLEIRGGTGVVFNNVFDNSTLSDADIYYSNYRAGGQTSGTPWQSTCQNSGTQRACFGTPNQDPIACTSDSQCGGVVGSCALTDGTGGPGLPAKYPCRGQIGTDSGNPQNIRPALFWNNRIGTSTQVRPQPGGNNSAQYLVEGRDFCVGPTTSSSDDATKPTSCGGKPVIYTPYVYPHPLTAGFASPRPVTNVQVASALLQWDAVNHPAVAGYRVYYGTSSGNYLQSPGQGVNVGSATQFNFSELASGTYFFVVTWVDERGNESPPSAEISKVRP